MKDRILVRRIYEFARPYKWMLLLSYFVLVVELIFHQMIPLFLEKVINFAVYEADLCRFLVASSWYGLVFLSYAACGYVQLILSQSKQY